MAEPKKTGRISDDDLALLVRAEKDFRKRPATSPALDCIEFLREWNDGAEILHGRSPAKLATEIAEIARQSSADSQLVRDLENFAARMNEGK